jgi:hypothetical protein
VPKKMGRKENVLTAKSKRFNLIKTKLAQSTCTNSVLDDP